MEKIAKVWFDKNRIYIETDKDTTYNRPLEAFPRLLEATPQQRKNYKIGNFGDDIRWAEVDEDIHISSFFTKNEPKPENPIAQLFGHFPELNVSQVAQSIGINKSLMSQYIYGIKKPSHERKKQIEKALHSLGKELLGVEL
ncbi:MAG: DUF2442 domain-containing protein [Bacteroidetes bacterium]|nr:DUF2442 domain-containing protein [Bacteroidota bacterium]